VQCGKASREFNMHIIREIPENTSVDFNSIRNWRMPAYKYMTVLKFAHASTPLCRINCGQLNSGRCFVQLNMPERR
jgi:hypothetical protein